MNVKLTLENVTLPLAGFTLKVNLIFTAPVTGVRGPSGAGKTSLIEIIAGLRRPTTGRVVLNKHILCDASARLHLPPEKRRVGYVPQDLALFPHLSTRANLYYGYREETSSAGHAERVIDLLEVRPLLSRAVHNLSGGEKQRVALGRALLASPQLLLLDEPLSSLDDRLKEKILPYLLSIREELHLPMIYVTHSQAELQTMCDEVITVEEGCVTAERQGDSALSE
jgi:molybdate transport system ATP-binding protein